MRLRRFGVIVCGLLAVAVGVEAAGPVKRLTAQECDSALGAIARKHQEIIEAHNIAVSRWESEYAEIQRLPINGMDATDFTRLDFAKRRELIPIKEAYTDRLKELLRQTDKMAERCGVPELKKREDDALKKALR